MKKAFITGLTGQDGSYLAEFLLKKGYEVHGILRRASVFNTERIEHIFKDINTYHSDLTDSSSINRLIEKIRPDEIYNLGAQSHVKVSFDVPEYTAETDGIGTLRILDAIRETQINTKFYQASTSEMFGGLPDTVPQSEKTPFHPRSPYGAAKLYSHWITVNYREAYNLFACSGILADKIVLGNLDAKRDWGFAPDYVEAMWMMLQAKTPDDYVIATGEAHTVREFCEKAFEVIGKKLVWKGKDVDEKAYDEKTGKVLIEISPDYFRPSEVDYLLGDPKKAIEKLGWKPKVKFEELVKIMVESDLEEVGKK